MPTSALLTENARRRAVALVVALTANTHLAPQRYERQLLDRFERGELTLDQVEHLLEISIHQVLYHSHSTARPAAAELQVLLDQSRRHNARHGITGVLLYSDGRYVQLLEGPEPAVEDLYARIRRDSRHTRLVTVSTGPGERRFPDWSMDFGVVTPADLEQFVHATQATATTPALPCPVITDPRLRKLLDAFS